MNYAAIKMSLTNNGGGIKTMLGHMSKDFGRLDRTGAYVQRTTEVDNMLARKNGASDSETMEKISQVVIQDHLDARNRIDEYDVYIDAISEGQYTVFQKGDSHFIEVFRPGGSLFSLVVPFNPKEWSMGYTEKQLYTGGHVNYAEKTYGAIKTSVAPTN